VAMHCIEYIFVVCRLRGEPCSQLAYLIINDGRKQPHIRNSN
jgi:hypothetical protein